jgi:hypothetical protein
MLAERTAQTRVSQQALDQLVDALRQVSAGRDIAEAHERGDYREAARRLAELGRNSDQLSSQATAQLGNALRNSSQAASNTPELAERERRAAQALSQNDFSAIEESLRDLAQTMQSTGDTTLTSEQLRIAWAELEEQRRKLGMQTGDVRASDVPTIQDDEGNPGAGLSDGAAQREAHGTRLQTAGVPVDVQLQAGPGSSRADARPGDRTQLAEITGASSSASALRPGEGRVIRAERHEIPGDLRPLLRRYFDDAGGPR